MERVFVKPKTRKCKECGERKEIREFKKSKSDYTKVCKSCINEKRSNSLANTTYDKFYIYRFLDKYNNTIYVGQTTNIDSRIGAHLNKAKNECNEMYEEIYWIDYAELKSDYHMNIYEIHYICKYKPKYNIQYASDNVDLFDLPEVEWKPYILNSYIQKFCFVNYKCNEAKNAESLKHNLENNKRFYDEFIKEYSRTKYVQHQFNISKYNNTH